MKKEIALGAASAPGVRSIADKIRERVNGVLPEDCQVKNAADGWNLAAVALIGVTLVFPPAVIAAGWCVANARREGGER